MIFWISTYASFIFCRVTIYRVRLFYNNNKNSFLVQHRQTFRAKSYATACHTRCHIKYILYFPPFSITNIMRLHSVLYSTRYASNFIIMIIIYIIKSSHLGLNLCLFVLYHHNYYYEYCILRMELIEMDMNSKWIMKEMQFWWKKKI